MRHTTLEKKKTLIDLTKSSTNKIFREFSYVNDILPKIKMKNKELTLQCYETNCLSECDINFLKVIIKKIKDQSQTVKLTISSEIAPVFDLVEDCISEVRKKRESYCFNIKQAQMINYCCKVLHVDVEFIVEFDSDEILRSSNYLHNDNEVKNFVEKELRIDYIQIKPIKEKKKYV